MENWRITDSDSRVVQSTNQTAEDMAFYFPKSKRSWRPPREKISSLVPGQQKFPFSDNTDLKEYVKQTLKLYIENTVEEVIDQVLVLRKYEVLERQLDGFVLTLKNLADADAIYIIIDLFLHGALNADLYDTAALLKILSAVLTQTTRNKQSIRNHIKLRLRQIVTTVPEKKKTSSKTRNSSAISSNAGVRSEESIDNRPLNPLLEVDGTASRAVIIAGILFANDILTPGFITALINSFYRNMSVQFFKLTCKVLTAVKDVQFHFTDLPNHFESTFLLKTYEHLKKYLYYLKKKKLEDKCTLENLQNMLLTAFQGSDHKQEVIPETPSPEADRVQSDSGKTWVSKLRDYLSPERTHYTDKSAKTVENPHLPEVDRETILNDLPLLMLYERLHDFNQATTHPR